MSQQQIGAAVSMPETTLPPPLTAKDIASSPGAAPAETAKAAQKQETAPGVDPTTADSAVSQQPIGAAVSMPETTLPPPLTAKDIASSPGAAPAETAKAAQKQETAPGVDPPPRTVRCPNNRSAQRSRCRRPHCRRR